MQPCKNCGAPLELRGPAALECDFCGVQAAPATLPAIDVKVTVAVAAPGTRPWQCPHCDRDLATVKLGEVELHGCGRCAGIWISNDNAAKVIASPDRAFWQLANRAARLALHARPRQATPLCPACQQALGRTVAYELLLDVCQAHGTWFDTGELGALVMNLRARAQADPSAAVQVKCIGCGSSVPQRETLVGELGPVCAACARAARLAALPETPAGLAGSILLDLHAGLYADVRR
jgi:Zn-finger nucleic acid-binding protein